MNKSYDNDIKTLVEVIERHRKNAYRKINQELVLMYFEIGKYLSNKTSEEKWGSKTVELISKAIRLSFPSLRGFTRTGLYRMIKFYETYRDNIIVPSLLGQISWTNNITILETTKTIEEKEFYIRLCIKNNYSSRELNRQINSGYYQRYILSNGNAFECEKHLVDEDDYPKTRILDQYSLEFLDLPNKYSEKDFRKAIILNLKQFILELGSDFSFIGEEYKIQVGNRDYYIDLLFYNRVYSCLVVVELKIGEFKPEYVSKMNFYLEALDRQEKREGENPSVGIILRSSKNETIVEYTLARTISNTTISTYQLDIIDKKILENKVIQLRNLLENKNG